MSSQWFLFNLLIDHVLRAFLEPSQEHIILANADDILLIADSAEDLQQYIGILDDSIQEIGPSLNPKKCYTMHLGAHPRCCIQTNFQIRGDRIPMISDSNIKWFLGKPIGFNISKDSFPISHVTNIGEKILSSLAPWQ